MNQCTSDLICYAQIRTKIRSSTREENHELKVGVPTRKENQDKQRKGLKTSSNQGPDQGNDRLRNERSKIEDRPHVWKEINQEERRSVE